MPKLTAAKINTIATVVVAGVTAGQKVWKTLNENESVSEQVKALTAKVKDATHISDLAQRLTAQLRVIQDAIAALPADHPQRAEWTSRATTLASKVPLAQAQSGSAKRATLKALRTRTSALLAEVIGDGIVDPEVIDQDGAPRKQGLRRMLPHRRTTKDD